MTDNSTCITVINITDYYARRNRVAKKKYGELKPNARFYMECNNEQCVNPDHMHLADTIFEEYGKKPCTQCRRWLPKNAFYDDKKSPNGKTSKCKTCTYIPTKA